jgi:hypothetical protein
MSDPTEGDRVHVGEHMTGVVISKKPFWEDGAWRVRVTIDGHDWEATPVLEIVRSVPGEAGR